MRVRGSVATLTLLLLAAPALAALRDVYAEALAALEAEHWQRAERLLREAIGMRDVEARRLPLKRIFQPYLPHYYLGAVLARGGDCRTALDEWRISREQGAIDAVGLSDEIERRVSICRERLDRLASLVDEIESGLEAADDKAARLDDPNRSQLLRLGYEDGLGSLGQRLESGRAALDEARAQLEQATAGEDLELAEATSRLVRETSLLLDGALADLERVDVEVATARARKRERIEEVRELAVRVGALLRSRTPLPPALRGRHQEIEALLGVAGALRETATLEQIEGLERRLESFLRQLERTTPPPPGALRSGAIAYLRGDYRAVLERLDEIPYRDGKARAHCLLLRSAAAFALHVAGGGDSDLLARAREDVLAAREHAPDLTPVPSAFSPRFVRFFETVAAAVPGA